MAKTLKQMLAGEKTEVVAKARAKANEILGELKAIDEEKRKSVERDSALKAGLGKKKPSSDDRL